MNRQFVPNNIPGSHKPYWQERAPDALIDLVKPMNLLGDPEAEIEWSQPVDALELFVPIASYREFLQDDALFVFGRRGTGKSSLINTLCYEVQNQNSKTRFTEAWVVKSDKIVPALTSILASSPIMLRPQQEQVEFLKYCWNIVYLLANVAAAATAKTVVFTKGASVLSELTTDVDMHSRTRFTEFSTAVATLLKEATPDANGKAPVPWENEFKKNVSAILPIGVQRELRKHRQSGHPALILVDGEELVVFDDKAKWTVLTALIDSVHENYLALSTNYLLVKAAMPSEIYANLEVANKDKVEQKQVFIHWRFKDLVAMIAKRFAKHIDGDHAGLSALNDYQAARTYLTKFFPSEISSRQGVTLDTIAYVIRHTQKKPRQLLQVLNTILTLDFNEKREADESIGIADFKFKLSEEVIRKGAHARLDTLVEGAIDVYKSIWPGASTIVKSVLGGARAYFEANELDRLTQKVNAIPEAMNRSKRDVKRLLFECGVLGVIHKSSALEKSDNKKLLLQAQFEYQIKNTISPEEERWLAVHPMFYGPLGTTLDMNTIVYPTPHDEEEMAIIHEQRVRLSSNLQ